MSFVASRAGKAKKSSMKQKRKAANALVSLALSSAPQASLPQRAVRVSSSELKYFDTSVSFTADLTGEVPATGQWCLIPQGTGESQRVGRKCVVKSVHFRGSAEWQPASSTTGSSMLIMYIVQDTQANGAAADVSGDNGVMTSASLESAMINMDNSQRFRILKKIRVPFNSQAGVSGAYSRVIKNLEFFLKCDIPLDFASTTGAITEIRSNNIFVLAGCSVNGDDLITVLGTARLRYSDQ